MFSLKYNEVSPPSFLKITGVDQYLLPEIEHYETSVTGSYGDVDGGVRFGKKVFTVHYIIQLDNAQVDVRNELLNYKTKYSDVDARYTAIKAERKALDKEVKSLERRIKKIDKQKENIRKNML